MSDLVVFLLRGGLLILMWLLIIAIVSSQAKDLQLRSIGPRVRKTKAGQEPRTATPGASAPAVPAQPKQVPRLLVITAGKMAGTEIPLNNAPILIGRSEEADLTLADDYTSGKHARLFPQGSRWFLEDLGSTNGTYLNNQQLTRAMAVEIGASIRIGKSMMELRV